MLDEQSGVTVLGFNDFPSRMAPQSSELYGQNLINLLMEMTNGVAGVVSTSSPAEKFVHDLTGDIIGQCTIVYKVYSFYVVGVILFHVLPNLVDLSLFVPTGYVKQGCMASTL